MRISDWSSDVCSSDLVQVRAVDVYKQVVFQQRHLERPADELGRVRAVDLTVQREKHGHVVLEVLALEVLLCLLHALSARPRLEDVAGDPEFAQGSRARDLRELRLERLRSCERRVGKEWVRPGRSRWS